jgi:transcriptional regulator GlxA family with amidase domain
VSASVAGVVRRAVHYIEANLTAPVTLEDIVRAAGVSDRGLFRHFRSATGVSPMVYLRNSRFARVRDALRRARGEERIVDIAALWGFDHMGRFAVEYRQRFGEKPSDTKASACMPRSGDKPMKVLRPRPSGWAPEAVAPRAATSGRFPR